MKKYLLTVCLLLSLCGLSTLLPAQQTQLSGELLNCEIDSLRLYEIDGGMLRPLAAAPLNPQAGTYTFSFALEALPLGFYLLGADDPRNSRLMILGETTTELKLTGQCNSLSQLKLWNSSLNTDYATVMQLAESQQQQFSQLVNQYRLAQRQGSDTGEILTAMARLDAAKVALLDSLKTANPFIAKTLALRTYLGYQSQPELAKIYSSEAEYFAKAYFRFVDFSDPAYNHIPDIHQAFRTYTYTLTRLGLSSQSQLQYIQDILAQIPAGSKAHKMALLGATAGLKGNNDDAYVQLAQAFIDQYGGEQGTVAAQLHQDVQSLRAQLVGGQAPEIHLPTPEGDSLRLSDLRGKVVLIDFWASWCGPCRRENPHVVRLYNKYKDKGFEILGVSLDRNKQSWVKAIEKDGLSWKHVSDLKYWQSEAARTYGVNAIPHTVLVDAEGKIIGKKLRGQALENKLAEIFGQ